MAGSAPALAVCTDPIRPIAVTFDTATTQP